MTPLGENRVARHLTAVACLYAGAAILTRRPYTVSHICHRTWHRGPFGKVAVLLVPVAFVYHVVTEMGHGCPLCALGAT
jgi:hypothetical protein